MLCVLSRRHERVRVPDHRNAILDTKNADFLIERAGAGVFGRNPPMTDPASNLAIGAGRVDLLGIGPVLDIAEHAAYDFGRLWIAAAVNRDNLDARSHLPHVARDLADELRQQVDDQARPALAGIQRDLVPIDRQARRDGISNHRSLIDVVPLALPAALVLLERVRVNASPALF